MEYTHYTIELAAFIVGVWLCFRRYTAKMPSPMVLIVLSILLGIISDGIKWFLAEAHQNTWNVHQIYYLIHTVIILFFFQFVIAGKRPESAGANLIFLNCAIVLAWMVVNFGLGQPFGTFATTIVAVLGGITAVVGVWAFSSIVRHTNPDIRFRQPEIWAVIGLVIYHTATPTLFFVVPHFSTVEAKSSLTLVWGILQGTTSVFKHSCFIYAFWLCRNNIPSQL
jgi:hypothetical protein